MAIICANCGQTLAKDDARFCSNCGASVPVSSAPTQPVSEADKASALIQIEQSKHGLHEAIVQQPPARPGSRSGSEKVAASDGKAQDLVGKKAYGDQAERTPAASIAWPAPMTHVSMNKSIAQKPEAPTARATEEAYMPARQAAPAVYERAIKKPEEAQPAISLEMPLAGKLMPALPDTPPLGPASHQELTIEAEGLEDRPTLLLENSSPVRPVARIVPDNVSMRSSAFSAPPKLAPAHSGGRLPFILIGVLLLILVVGGISTWVVVAQPFSVPAITQPQQHFQNASLGVSLLYPTGWGAQVDHAKSTVHFFDSSHTAQVDIIVAGNASSDPAKSVQQQAAQLGMTGGQTGTQTFAGLSWQNIQGSVQQNGANYSGSILATVRGNHLITFIQLAPQSVYSDEEKLIFQPMRTSLQLS